jgi:hypothetical protein
VANPAVQFLSGGKAGKKELVRVRDPKTGEIVVKQVPGEIMPAVRYLIVLAAAGAGTEALLKLLFGLPGKEATLAEIMAAMNRDTAEAFGLLLQKIKGYHLMAGSLGILGNYAQMGFDFTRRSRFKNPADPPGLDPLKQVASIALDWMEQGQLTQSRREFRRTCETAGKSRKQIERCVIST